MISSVIVIVAATIVAVAAMVMAVLSWLLLLCTISVADVLCFDGIVVVLLRWAVALGRCGGDVAVGGVAIVPAAAVVASVATASLLLMCLIAI